MGLLAPSGDARKAVPRSRAAGGAGDEQAAAKKPRGTAAAPVDLT